MAAGGRGVGPDLGTSPFIQNQAVFDISKPEGAAVVYGLTKNIDTYNPLRVATHGRGIWALDAPALEQCDTAVLGKAFHAFPPSDGVLLRRGQGDPALLGL